LPRQHARYDLILHAPERGKAEHARERWQGICRKVLIVLHAAAMADRARTEKSQSAEGWVIPGLS
jgi:hypothetical protein